MGARLAVNVVVLGPSGEPRAFLEGDTVPDWAADQIGPHCFEDGDDAEEASAEGTPPPKSGRGSSVEAWAAYADAHDVTVDDDAKREDIIAACEAAGVPTE